MRPRSRRDVLALGLAATLGTAAKAKPGWTERRVVALNWALAETLYGMRVRPVGAAEVPSYDALVREPPTPAGVVDVGFQGDPNLELLHDLAPELILIQSWQASFATMLRRCGPVEMLTLFPGFGDALDHAEAATRRLGVALACAGQAEALVTDTALGFATHRAQLGSGPRRPLYLVQTIDRNSLTVFAAGGLFQGVLDRLGLRNAWTGAPDLLWGGSRIGVDKLAADEQAILVMIAPARAGAEEDLAGTALWSHLPAVRAGRVVHLPFVWGFGALPTAARFARLLTEALLALPYA